MTEVLKNFPTDAEIREVLSGIAEQVVITRLPYYWHLRYLIEGNRESF